MIHDLIWGHSQVCSNLPDGRGLAPTSSTKDGIHSCHLTSNAVAGEMLLHCAYPACCCIQRRVLLCAVSPSQPKFFFSCYYFVTLIKLQAGAVQLILFTWYFILYCRGAFGKMQCNSAESSSYHLTSIWRRMRTQFGSQYPRTDWYRQLTKISAT